MLNCREATRLISDKQERTLSAKERLTLQLHLMLCGGCQNFNRQIPFLHHAMRAYVERLDTVLEAADADPAPSKHTETGTPQEP